MPTPKAERAARVGHDPANPPECPRPEADPDALSKALIEEGRRWLNRKAYLCSSSLLETPSFYGFVEDSPFTTAGLDAYKAMRTLYLSVPEVSTTA